MSLPVYLHPALNTDAVRGAGASCWPQAGLERFIDTRSGV